MNKDEFPEIETPLNAQERLLHSCAVRLDALCHMMSSLLEHIAEKDNIATTSNKVVEREEEKPKKKTTRKSTKK
jgi:hypothetical protein